MFGETSRRRLEFVGCHHARVRALYRVAMRGVGPPFSCLRGLCSSDCVWSAYGRAPENRARIVYLRLQVYAAKILSVIGGTGRKPFVPWSSRSRQFPADKPRCGLHVQIQLHLQRKPLDRRQIPPKSRGRELSLPNSVNETAPTRREKHPSVFEFASDFELLFDLIWWREDRPHPAIECNRPDSTTAHDFLRPPPRHLAGSLPRPALTQTVAPPKEFDHGNRHRRR